MSRELTSSEEKSRVNPAKSNVESDIPQKDVNPTAATVLNLQQKVGNQAVQRLLAQRSGGEEGFDLDESTAGRINQARGGGQPLDGAVQNRMSEAMGFDFSGVRVHTSSEADTLNQDLGAKAFTTGQDIFFKEGAYNPSSSDGQELIAHEAAHVVQQSTGRVGGGGGGMTVRPAGDAFEQEADAVARQVTSPGEADVQTKAEGGIQRQEMLEEEEPPAQMKADDSVQRQEALEEEEPPLQMKTDESVQRQEMLEEEEPPAQMKADDSGQRMTAGL